MMIVLSVAAVVRFATKYYRAALIANFHRGYSRGALARRLEYALAKSIHK